ncbi:EF-hand domain-containing protein [Nocardia sp. CDC159]|uniref:EF-hand domain-containing protein n=1 Tax=Nocardia pulmonis TaxID=2951408 RepID=A0A9X2IZR3_9NOCA|nr:MULTISPECIES: EF-hand domain-containing protein [Nocardia]MCM6778387.1 EF-hand domain-containing protein [Nocardia pulmonis]MCM6791217.1 EF-hand domain-containing protein [Nocardia sp. CDC159]
MRFDLLDANGDGVLEESDFLMLAERIITGLGEPPTSAKARALMASHRGYWQGLLAHADANGDGVVSRAEYLAAVTDSTSNAAYLRPYADAVAAICDRNDDGMIDRAEYTDYMRVVGFDADHAAAMFAKLDTAGTGRITATEWADVICRYYTNTAEDPIADLLTHA